jgi:hypothetical protein
MQKRRPAGRFFNGAWGEKNMSGGHHFSFDATVLEERSWPFGVIDWSSVIVGRLRLATEMEIHDHLPAKQG